MTKLRLGARALGDTEKAGGLRTHVRWLFARVCLLQVTLHMINWVQRPASETLREPGSRSITFSFSKRPRKVSEFMGFSGKDFDYGNEQEHV